MLREGLDRRQDDKAPIQRTVRPKTSTTKVAAERGCDDCVSAGLVDEWLQARNELSIEIFLQDSQSRSSPVFCA